jgi:predicted enzyme related to lactoylglutathione lyase
MAGRNAVGWFEIPVNDLARAKRFYEKVFGVTLQPLEMGGSEMEMFPASPELPGAGGALIKTDGYTPSHAGSVIYFSVASIEDALARVGASGGQTLVPKLGIGEFGFIAQFQDTEGNRIALHAMQ